MRDPLRNVSVRFKLAFTFLGVCLLAFGVGGVFVSQSAREALEREILTRLRFQSQFFATAFEGDLRALGLRARDFASDGYIRSYFDDFVSGSSGADRTRVESDLRRHLLENKLVLEPAFLDLALIDVSGEHVFRAGDGEDWTQALPPEAYRGQDWYSGLDSDAASEGPPAVLIGTPLQSLDGDARLGTLVLRVHCAAWIASAMRSTRSDVKSSEFRLRLIDARGRSLEIPHDFFARDGAERVIGEGVGLRVRSPRSERDVVRPSPRGVLSESFPIALNGWSLETSVETQEALAAVAGLQSRFLLVGVALTAAACLILLFPMRFLAGPIRRLRDAAMTIGEGDPSVRVPVDSTDEIGELSNSFNLMAQAIEERTLQLSTTAKSLEQRKNDLRSERDRLNAVISSMRDGLIVLDADGVPEVWNHAAEPLREVVQNGGLELSAHRLCHRANGNGEVHDAPADEGHPCVECLFEPTAPPRSCLLDAGPSVFEVHSTRLAPGMDGRAGRVLVARDVTDRVARDEREIHQERLAVLGEVAAVMAHELNNPLAAISMFAQMIESKLPDDSKLREDVAVIERNAATCGRTIRELLDYATGATPEVGPVDVHESLREVASFLRAFRERRDDELVLDLGADDPVVTGDEVQLRQVFVNLVLNALQAVEEGRVFVTTRLDRTHLVIDVRDEGPGIAPELAESVFKPFFTTKPRGSGTGLGLSTARRITEIQGGGLELIDRRPGHTTFRVRLLRTRS